MGFFPVDEATVDYLRATGRTDAEIDAFAAYFKAQGLFGMPRAGDIDYTQGAASSTSRRSGPRSPARSARRTASSFAELKATFADLLGRPTADNGFAQAAGRIDAAAPRLPDGSDLGNGDVLIAAITSCTNTSNPGVLLAAGPAREEGGREGPHASGRASRPRSRRARAWSPTT